MDESLIEVLANFLALPIQLLYNVMWSFLDFLTFDVLQLGGYLPITF